MPLPDFALNFHDVSRRNNNKFPMSKGIKMLSHELIRLKILPSVDVDLQDLVFGTMKRNQPVTNNILCS